ncbi:hypothetical protein DX142_09120 [Listeria monocytogenes]|nr:hypothetical protein [Listeria monocytogenes]MCV85788.1 hypothetical protein [Listeria monocytogenes]
MDVLYETNNDGKVVRQYVYSDDGIRLAMKMNGKSLYYHYNADDDVIALTDEAGKIVAEYTYDAWGNVLKNNASTEEAKANSYGYKGYTYDKEIEQYYLMARYYEPEQGVFTAVDPDPGDEDDPQTMNGYNYASNNPVMLADPDGLWAGVLFKFAAKGGKTAWKYAKKGAKKVSKSMKKWWKGFKAKPKKRQETKQTNSQLKSFDSDKRKHITEPEHQWNSVSDGSWGQVQALIKRTMRSGKESSYKKSARKKTLIYNKRKIIVTFVRKDGKIKIGNAWVERK